ncbi:YhgE/Pip domain-containing protein [Paenibacillus harenae]|uniref:YhgE/Pip domain-containing protein n=1 Tax=Paenibacillus harenae TaxID=306543 RepID=UPI00278CA4F6|nr:ABC transporter permease [Paenibacillus harenae]MDQ0063537.1 YhgE/Pip-like protein [Paenibacillus harenae]
MGTAIKAFMKRPTTIVGIVTALMFQIIFSVIWMTGYNGVTDRVDQLRIAVVNEDTQFGQQIAANLVKELPFDMVQIDNLEEAKEQLDARELQMVVHVPADFSQKASVQGEQASVQYLINESNPALIKSIMSGAASQMTSEINTQAVSAGLQNVLGSLNMPEEQATAAAASLSQRVVSDIQSTNIVQGMNNQMVPMMMVLASYVGAMIMGMNLEQSSMAVSGQVSRWRRFGARSIINTVAALFVSLVGATLLVALGGQIEQGFLLLWLFEFVFLLTFMFVSQMFLYLFGMAGMLFNIMLLSAQLVSSGAIVPRELLSDFYTGLGSALPATYAVDGNMNLLFGGPSIGTDLLSLIVITVVAAAISVFAVAIKRPQPVPQPTAAIASHKQS